MRNAILWITTLIVFMVVNVQIVQKEFLLKQGITMLLRPAPVDPRSLIQGDYTALRYDLPDFLQEASLPRNGQVVVRLDEHQVTTILCVFILLADRLSRENISFVIVGVQAAFN